MFLPEVSTADVPAGVTLKSSDNIPIESLWSYLLKFCGHDIKEVIISVRANGYFHPGLRIDVYVLTSLS
jgi:hypothetical protein